MQGKAANAWDQRQFHKYLYYRRERGCAFFTVCGSLKYSALWMNKDDGGTGSASAHSSLRQSSAVFFQYDLQIFFRHLHYACLGGATYFILL